MSGGNGDDILIGQAGADRLSGHFGHDTLDGGIGRDKLEGGDGNDNSNGAAHADSIEGGYGNDTLIGGIHQDPFVFNDLRNCNQQDSILDWGTFGVGGVQFQGENIVIENAPDIAFITIIRTGDDTVIAYSNTTITVENSLASMVQDFLILS